MAHQINEILNGSLPMKRPFRGEVNIDEVSCPTFSNFEKIYLMMDVKIKKLLISVRISKGKAANLAAGVMKK